MPSIQLISQKSEFKKLFKDKFKSSYTIFTSETVKDGIRSFLKTDIDLLILDVQPQRIKSYTWVDSLLRQKNIYIGEIGIIFLIDPEYIQNLAFQKLLAIKRNIHFFWVNTSTFKNSDTLFIAFDTFLKNTLHEVNALRTNFILRNRLITLSQTTQVSEASSSVDPDLTIQPVSFLPHNNTNVTFLNNLQKSTRNWPLVMLRGAEGLEQESIAKYIHEKNNSQHQFMTIDLSEIPEYFHEDVLFGLKQKNLPGFKYINNSMFEVIKKGTLYIKNIEYLKWEVQNDLFHVLQNSYYQREDGKLNIKCKFIFSSSVDLERYVEKGLMRQDLYSHLAVYTLGIPTIVQRKKDIPLLIDDYLKWYDNKYHKKIEITSEARLLIMKNSYPGQFDQLYGYLFKIFSICNGTITPETVRLFESDIVKKAENSETVPPSQKTKQPERKIKQNGFVREKGTNSNQLLFSDLMESKNLDYSLIEIEREYIKHVLTQNYNNIAETARILGITRKTLYDKLKKYKITTPVKKTG
ncbi:MAG: sigma 54-interacting transcriptional regulator [Spirochaetia bacterium]|nr:sigma 54-interacting transcriptional regulator [Spirochaetia bacterium]